MKVKFFRLFQNRNLLCVTAVFALLAGVYFTYNTLYPWRGDDFLCHVQLRSASIFEVIRECYFEWTLRLGNVVSVFFEALESKTLFNVCNTVIQIFIVWLLCVVSAGKIPSISSDKDTLLLLFAAGLSVFVCRPADTVYWVPGATLYSWAAAVWLGCAALLFKFEKCDKLEKWKCFLLIFAGFCSGYTNENVALTGLFFLVVRAYFKPSMAVFCVAGAWFAGAVFLFTTPGVLHRIAAAGGNSLSIGDIAAKIPEIAGFYVASSLIPLVFFILLLIFSWRKCSKELLFKTGVLIALSGFAALVFAGCPLPPMRSYYACSVLVIMACCAVFDGANYSLKQRRIVAAVTLAAGLCMLFIALPDFIKIHQDEVARMRLISAQRAEKVETVVVPEHRTLRRSFLQYIFIEDITSDTSFWLNGNAALYYQVNKIKSIPQGKSVPLFRDRFMRFFMKGGKR